MFSDKFTDRSPRAREQSSIVSKLLLFSDRKQSTEILQIVRFIFYTLENVIVLETKNLFSISK